jgi:hypothetical protein
LPKDGPQIEVEPRVCDLALVDAHDLRERRFDPLPGRRNVTGRAGKWAGMRTAADKFHRRRLIVGHNGRRLDLAIGERGRPSLKRRPGPGRIGR